MGAQIRRRHGLVSILDAMMENAGAGNKLYLVIQPYCWRLALQSQTEWTNIHI